jgi:hypothetical protein
MRLSCHKLIAYGWCSRRYLLSSGAIRLVTVFVSFEANIYVKSGCSADNGRTFKVDCTGIPVELSGPFGER